MSKQIRITMTCHQSRLLLDLLKHARKELFFDSRDEICEITDLIATLQAAQESK